MTILLLIRHSENDYLKMGVLIGSTPGVHLNIHGQDQAGELARALKHLPIKAIYASPMERAVETAEPLAREKELKIVIRPSLGDTDVGDWTGRKIQSLKKLPIWKQLQEKPSTFTFPGGESFVSQQKRLVNEIVAIAASHGTKDVVAVFFHADPIKLIISHYVGIPLDNFQRLSINPSSVSIICVDNTESQLVALNLQTTCFEQRILNIIQGKYP